jgi:hypothetical protein
VPGLTVQSAEAAERRQKFFKLIFGRTTDGYICVSRKRPEGKFEERFFHWPNEEAQLHRYITEAVFTHNVWFCPMVFGRANKSKFDVRECPTVWSDLDTCPPDVLLVAPTITIESSPERYQGIWCLKDVAEPIEAEAVAKAIAYFHADQGADKSGWDLTQLLRVPYTLNFKYDPTPMVAVIGASDVVSLDALREAYPDVKDDVDALWPMPEEFPDAEQLMRHYREHLPSRVWMLLRVPPDKDWSKALWNLEMSLAEADLSREEMFSIVQTAACNKYARDGRNDALLWKDVCKAWQRHHERNIMIQELTPTNVPDLLSEEDFKSVIQDQTFVDDYIAWAKTVGDASEVYHQAGAFICLSALMSGSVQLPTSFGTIMPNLWFLLLADTTLTRKSTALDLAIDMLTEVDKELIMATDGSIEGMFSALSLRPGKPSIFLRDEFSGLLEMMTKKDYYAGMGEALTKMYDGRLQKRVLRREVIEVTNPILLIFAGGIRTKILQLLTSEQVTSGFIPRFIFISGQSDISKLRPLGPPVEAITTGRDKLLSRLVTYRDTYTNETAVKIGDKEVKTRNVRQAKLTTTSWALYNEMEKRLLQTGISHAQQDLLTPVMDRLAKSGLKAAILIAASRLPRGEVIVQEQDIFKAFSFVSEWRGFAMDVVSAIGLPEHERRIERVYSAILRQPGITRSRLMQNYHLTKRDADWIFETLDQRGLINVTKSGKGFIFTPVGSEES